MAADPTTVELSMSRPLVSIVINNYNYARFLRDAIDSALNQTYPLTKVVVVDDGSSDGSREIIAGYGDRVVPIFKENGGQASAFNAGVSACRGDIICFLDSDDFFYPEKVAQIVQVFRAQGVNSKPMMLHHLLAVKNHAGEDVGNGALDRSTHRSPLNLYDFAKRYRFLWCCSGPTSGISINKLLADRLFPIPEGKVRVSADDFIILGASLLAPVYSLDKYLGGYRVHDDNNWYHSRTRKSPEFRHVLDEYLNAKLVENGMLPVVSFYDSMFVWGEFVADRQWSKLGWHMLRLSVKQHDLYTARVICSTARMIAGSFKKSLLQRIKRLRKS
jgi:glycosyltransferase involved in cell wall biosynthesis